MGGIAAFPTDITALLHQRNFDRVVSLELTFRAPTRVRVDIRTAPWTDPRWINDLEFLINARGVGRRCGTITQRLDGGVEDGRMLLVVALNLKSVHPESAFPPPEHIVLISGDSGRMYSIIDSRPR